MAKRKTIEEKVALIEAKYSRRVEKLLHRMRNDLWKDCWAELMKLKDKMKKELEEIENREYQMDKQDVVRDER